MIVYFDGPDGAGKTTQLELAAEALRADGHTVYVTRVLGGSPIGELLRAAALSETARPVETDLHVALACHYASSKELLERHAASEIVLVDRSPLSILAYQVSGDGLAAELGYQACGEILDLIQPNLIITYSAPPEQLVERRMHRNIGGDYFENKSDDYHARVAGGFSTAATHFGAKVVDGSDSQEHVHSATMQLLYTVLESQS